MLDVGEGDWCCVQGLQWITVEVNVLQPIRWRAKNEWWQRAVKPTNGVRGRKWASLSQWIQPMRRRIQLYITSLKSVVFWEVSEAEETESRRGDDLRQQSRVSAQEAEEKHKNCTLEQIRIIDHHSKTLKSLNIKSNVEDSAENRGKVSDINTTGKKLLLQVTCLMWCCINNVSLSWTYTELWCWRLLWPKMEEIKFLTQRKRD